MATEGDITELCEIDYELFPENNFNEWTLRNELSRGVGHVLLVEGKLAGYLLVHVDDDGLIDILRLGIREPYRRQGLATHLLRTALHTDRTTMLTVKRSNHAAIRLYRKHGFTITGMLPQHDCWVMRVTGRASSP